MGTYQGNAVKAVFTAMAEQIDAAAPRGWKRAELRGYAAGPDAAGHRGLRFEPDELNEYGANDIDVFDGMGELHTLLEASDNLTIELELESRGRYRAMLSERLDRTHGRGFRYLLDPDSAPPEPGELQTSPDALEAGDPGEAVALLGEYLRRLGEILGPGSERDLPPPLPELERQEIMADLGVVLPQDLNALYAAVDGDGGRGLLHGHGWFGLEMLAEFCDPEERWWVTRGWRRHVSPAFINEFGPPLTVRRLSDCPAWIPFATDTFGNYLAVDMAPGPRGRPGQVILIGRNHGDGPTYVADSVTSLLRRHVDALASGSFKRGDEGGLWINAGDLEHHKRHYSETCTLEVTGLDAAPVRGMRPEIRELTVRNAPWAGFGPVRGAPALWQVSVHNCPGADLSPLRDTPVEVLDLAMDTIDLTGLENHPTVRRVVLHSEKPVDLRPLLSCPRLHGLDLTDALAADVSVLGEATRLQYLKLQRPQWEELWRRKAVPASLALAELAEEPPQERKLYWS
ncbi:MAG: SMI1/KNR4 family protein, partial [Micromonosporaceae bacterium]